MRFGCRICRLVGWREGELEGVLSFCLLASWEKWSFSIWLYLALSDDAIIVGGYLILLGLLAWSFWRVGVMNITAWSWQVF